MINRRAQIYLKMGAVLVDRAQPSNPENRKMTQVASIRPQSRSYPKCRGCGAAMRLFGIEPHPAINWTDLLTYVCSQCDGVQTEIVPPAKLKPLGSLIANKAFDAETTGVLGSAFDATWERVKAAQILPTDKRQVASMRELVAKSIIAKAEQGEKDPKRLIETALLRLRMTCNGSE